MFSRLIPIISVLVGVFGIIYFVRFNTNFTPPQQGQASEQTQTSNNDVSEEKSKSPQEIISYGLSEDEVKKLIEESQVAVSVGITKIPAINSTYFTDLNGSLVTNVDAQHLGGKAASSFLRSDENDTVEAVLTFTAAPGSSDVSGGPLYVNPRAAGINYTLLGAAVNGTHKFKVDAEGDVTMAGTNLSIGGISYTFPSSQGGASTVLTNDGSGVLSWSAASGGSITADSLNFTDIIDSMTLDANLAISASGSNYSLNIDSGTLYVDTANNYIGIGTTAPDSKLESLTTSGEQLRLTYTDGSVYTGFTVNSGGDLKIEPSGGGVSIGNGTASSVDLAGHDLYVTGDLEIDGAYYGDGTNLTNVAKPSYIANSYTLYKSGSTYYAKSTTGGTDYSNSDFVTVLENVVADVHSAGGGTINLQQGTFDMGSSNFTCNAQNNVVIQGQGIDATIIQNSSDAASDTEPLSFTNCKRWTIRDLTVSAGGAARTSSDAIDGDGADHFLIERVKVSGSRSRGIVFDGKDTTGTGTADQNVIRDCIVTGTQGTAGDGIELLASSRNLIESCKIYDVTGNGIQATKASSSASQANKKSIYNEIIGNDIYNSGRDGINILSSDYNKVIGNSIINSADDTSSKDGIRIETSDSITADYNIFANNTITDDQTPKTQRYGINISATSNNTVVSNNTLNGNLTGTINDAGTNTEYSQHLSGNNILAVNENVGVGTTGPQSKVQISGGGLCVGSDANCNTDNNTEGVIYSSSTSTTVYDVAENYPTKDTSLVATEVVELDSANSVFVKRAEVPYSTRIVGVISEEPGVLLGGFNGAQFAEEKQVAIALAGRVRVKISENSESISVGDYLTASYEPGKAMKATRSGYVIGKALESWNPGEDKDTILFFIETQFYTDSNSDSALQLSLPSEIDESILHDIQSFSTENLESIDIDEEALPELSVLGKSLLTDTTITGVLMVGGLMFDNETNDINALGTLNIQGKALGPIQFMNNQVEFDTAGNIVMKTGVIKGNDLSRGKEVLKAGQTTIKIEKKWAEEPVSINATPSYETIVSISELTKDGFTIKVKDSNASDQTIYWSAFW